MDLFLQAHSAAVGIVSSTCKTGRTGIIIIFIIVTRTLYTRFLCNNRVGVPFIRNQLPLKTLTIDYSNPIVLTTRRNSVRGKLSLVDFTSAYCNKQKRENIHGCRRIWTNDPRRIQRGRTRFLDVHARGVRIINSLLTTAAQYSVAGYRRIEFSIFRPYIQIRKIDMIINIIRIV